MARNDILWMARQADREWDCDRNMVEWLEHFAGLVAQMEREACARVCDDLAANDKLSNYYAVAARAIRAMGIDGARVGEIGIWGEKPPVKTYCGGKPNYCTPEHEPWCDSVTKLLLSMPPQIPPCNCKPKREWVGLTDEEIYDYADKFLYQHGSNYGIKSFGKAIEAKLKEKNA